MSKKKSGFPYREGTEDYKRKKEGRFYTPSKTKCKHCGDSPLDAYYMGNLKKCKKCGGYN